MAQIVQPKGKLERRIIGSLIAACEAIKSEAGDIVGSLNDVVSLTIMIRMEPDSIVTYDIMKTKTVRFREDQDV